VPHEGHLQKGSGLISSYSINPCLPFVLRFIFFLLISYSLTIYSLCSFYSSYSFIVGFPSLSHILALYGLNFFYPTFYVSFLLYLFRDFFYFCVLIISFFFFPHPFYLSSVNFHSFFYHPVTCFNLLFFFHLSFLNYLLPLFLPSFLPFFLHFSRLHLPTERILRPSCLSVCLSVQAMHTFG